MGYAEMEKSFNGTHGQNKDYKGTNWVHSLANPKSCQKRLYIQTMSFGENISSLIDTNRIFLVESEKTAIICSNFFNENVIWMATGGIGILKQDY